MIRIDRNSRRYWKLAASVVPIVFSLTTSSAFGGLLTNPGFDTPTPGLTPPNYTASISGPSGGLPGVSSADGWYLYNNSSETTTSELLTSTDPMGGGYMISVSTPGHSNGLEQHFSTVSEATASIDIYVLSGNAWLALYSNDGNTLLASVTSTTTNQWQTLALNVASGNPDTFAVYSSPGGGASFYADNAQVMSASVPEPSSVTLAIIAVLPVIGYWCRKRRCGPTAPR
jgi:hypothetical protein